MKSSILKSLSKNQTVSPIMARSIISELGGRFATITAFKKDGTETVINGQLADSPPSHDSHDNLFSIKKGGKVDQWRSIDYSRISKIAFNGMTIEVKQAKG